MKKRVLSFVAATVMLSAAMPASAAPLFPDVKDDHWAKDAVAKLAAQGLLEGYPDGTFKGDRAATRWEVAMIVARLLAKMEQAHATFATKAELDEVRKLANALKEELDALGVRVTNLEENVSRLDKRVTELERITFYGYVDVRGSVSHFYNEGVANNYGGNVFAPNGSTVVAAPGFAGTLPNVPTVFAGGQAVSTVPALSYNGFPGVAAPGLTGTPINAQPGSLNAAGLTPWNHGTMGVMDYRNGRPLLDGVGFTARAVLGLRVRVSDDIDAGAEFSAFTSQGNQFIDAYWGVTAPWQSNTFTSNAPSTGAGALANAPYSRMTLDSFWVVHNPSQTKLILGAFQETNMDSLIYAGQWNPGAYGPRYLGGFGFNASGKWDISETGVLRWEALGTRLGDNSFYDTFLIGGNIEFEFDFGSVKGSVARVSQDIGQNGIGSLTVGNTSGAGNTAFLSGFNANPAAVGTGLGTGSMPFLQWVNPVGFGVLDPGVGSGGAGSNTDNRPIPGQNGFDSFSLSNFGQTGGIGDQSMMMYGGSGALKFDFGGGDNQVYVAGNIGYTDYSPNNQSSYTVDGLAFRAEVGVNLLDGDLDIGAQYIHVDSTYDPFVLQNGGLGVGVSPMNLPNLNYYQGLYSLHDTSIYPHNRRGFRGNGQFRFAERRGLVWGKIGWLEQVDTSLYDRRTGGVFGFNPGFMDPVFAGYATPFVYGSQSANSFNAVGATQDDPTGDHFNWGVGASYKFADPGIKIEVGYERNEFNRSYNSSFADVSSQNSVDLGIGALHGQLSWEASDKWTLRAGADYTTIDGHYDPAGRYNQFALATGSSNFNNIDSTQFSPFVGFDYDISANTQWNMDFRYYTTTSNNGGVQSAPFGANLAGSSSNPFEWNGWQVSTQFKVKF